MDDNKTITECKEQVVALRTYQNLQRLKVSFTIAEIVSYCEEHQNIDPLLLPIEDRPIQTIVRPSCLARFRLSFGICPKCFM
jgi:hypothetical protein